MCVIGSAEGIGSNRASQWQAQGFAKSLVPFLSLLIVRWLMGEIRVYGCSLLCCNIGQFVDWFISCSACHYKTNKKHLNGIGSYYSHLTTGNKWLYISFCFSAGSSSSLFIGSICFCP